MTTYRNGISFIGPITANGTTGTANQLLTGTGFDSAEDAVEKGWRSIPPLKRMQAPERISVIWCLGQSNMAGGIQDYTPARQGADAPHPRVMELSRGSSVMSTSYRSAPSGELQTLRLPSQAAASVLTSFDPALPLGKRFAELVPGTSKVVVINRAVGGTGFGAGDWTYDGGPNSYSVAKDEMIAFLAAHPEASLVAVCWHQGEADSGAAGSGGMAGTDYGNALAALVNDIRTTVPTAAGCAFVCGTMHPTFVANTTDHPKVAEIDAVHRDIGTYVGTNSDFVDMSAFTASDSSRAGVHFAEDGIRYMGQAMAEKIIPLIDANQTPRLNGVWMEYDENAGEFRDRWGSQHRVFDGTYVEDQGYGKVLSVQSSTGYNTDIPLSNREYTKIIRVRFRTPTSGYASGNYQLVSGALDNHDLTPTPANGTLCGHLWGTQVHQHQFGFVTYSNTTSGATLGSLIPYDRYCTLALTYDSSQAAGSRFAEYFNGASAGTVVTTGTGDDLGGQSVTNSDLIVQIGCYSTTAQTPAWAGQVAAVVILPYAATAAEVAAIHEELDRRERESEAPIYLGSFTTAASFNWKTLALKPGTYRAVITDVDSGGSAANTNRPSDNDLPWDAAVFAGAPLGANVYELEVRHTGGAKGSVVASSFAQSTVGSNDIIYRRFSCQVSSTVDYASAWTRTTPWVEETYYRESSDGVVWKPEITTGGVETWTQA